MDMFAPAHDPSRADPAPTSSPWWLQTQPEAALPTGLTQAEAGARLQANGPNRIEAKSARPLWWQFLTRFRNPLVLILLLASAISVAVGEISNFVTITLMVVMSVTLDFVQEHRANQAAEKLRESVALRATVLRDGVPSAVPVSELVVGDVVSLSAGDRVPADGRIVQARDFFVNQALLTGESYPVEKKPGDLPAQALELQQATNAAFMGTSVISGSAQMQVMATGAKTALGDIAHTILHDPAPTAFEVGTHRFGLLILRITALLVLFVLMVNVVMHRPLLDSFLFALALAVGLTPELLPMVISVTLANGAIRMARQRVIVKRLPAIQNLGSMDVLCTDKTGTLTEAKISLDRCVDAQGLNSERVLMLAYLNSVFESGLRSPLDEAILAHPWPEAKTWTKIDEVPFDFERRRVSVLVERGDERWLVVKGAPDDVLTLCSTYEPGADVAAHALDQTALTALRERCHELERQGLRVLAVAWRAVSAEQRHADVRDETQLVFAGFAAFIDPPKVSAGAALADLAKRGVKVNIVSGDSELVTQHLCAMLKVPVQGVLTGTELAQMDEVALRARVAHVNLFCRVNPAQKNRIILALRARGHVVGYMGDGINDAPPLRSADVGITVDSAVDVAKEVADIILLDPDLGVLHAGVVEGRRTFGNILKYIMMGTSSNFGNMLSMAAASVFLPFLPMLPGQILLNNVLYDLSEMSIPLDRVDEQDLLHPRRLNMSFITRFMWFFGVISSLFDGLTFLMLIYVLKADAALFRTGWFVESLLTQVLVIFVIRTRGWPWASKPSAVLLASSLLVAVAAVLLPVSPLAHWFGFVTPPLKMYALIGGLLAMYLVLAQACKSLFYRHAGRWR